MNLYTTPIIAAVWLLLTACSESDSAAPLELISPQDSTTPKTIAHAGGGYLELTYTNSLEALEHNKTTYSLFELDFSFTSDGHLVCIHDWKDSVKRSFGVELAAPPDLATFSELVATNSTYKKCTIPTLLAWLEANPGKVIVTDVKDRNVEALRYISSRYEDFSNRFIPQIYHPNEYDQVQAIGYEKIILTLYRYAGSDDDVLTAAAKHDYYAITMPKGRVRKLAPNLQKSGIYSYVHTVNTLRETTKFRNLGISDIYTDWLPNQPKE